MATLSKESTNFLENLRVYLMADGKREREINEIVSELRAHLQLAEADGKSVKHIIGHSPSVYMNQISQEMKVDKKELFGYFLVIVFGILSFNIILNAFNGVNTYSLLNIIGTLSLLVLFLLSIRITFKQLVTKKENKVRTILYCAIPSFILLISFIALIFIDRKVQTPTIQLTQTLAWVLAGVSLLILIGLSLWSKTTIILIVLAFLLLPKLMSYLFTLSLETEMILSAFIPFIGIGIYLFIVNKRM